MISVTMGRASNYSIHTYLRRPLRARNFSLTSSRLQSDPKSPFATGPAPPRLPKEEQEIFEQLQRQSTGTFSTPAVNQSPVSSPSSASEKGALIGPNQLADGGELHPDLRTGAKPEFEGDVNPRTGEVGGPKNEPLRWGAAGDWSYNGRVTDF